MAILNPIKSLCIWIPVCESVLYFELLKCMYTYLINCQSGQVTLPWRIVVKMESSIVMRLPPPGLIGNAILSHILSWCMYQESQKLSTTVLSNQVLQSDNILANEHELEPNVALKYCWSFLYCYLCNYERTIIKTVHRTVEAPKKSGLKHQLFLILIGWSWVQIPARVEIISTLKLGMVDKA